MAKKGPTVRVSVERCYLRVEPMKNVMWELRSASDFTARCSHQHDPPSGHIVTVTVGDSERFHEEHQTEAEARDEAGHLLLHYMARGWTETVYRDSRLNVALLP